MLDRLIPHTRNIHVHLLGSGMPPFFVADLSDMWLTLGLAGWTANNWSRLGNFDLTAPRADVDYFTKKRIFSALKENWCESADSLAGRLQLERTVVQGAMSAYTRTGMAIFDLNHGVYWVRELSRVPLPLDALRFSNDREANGTRLLDSGLVKNFEVTERDAGKKLKEEVLNNARSYTATLVVDSDERLLYGECNCAFYKHNRMNKGPL